MLDPFLDGWVDGRNKEDTNIVGKINQSEQLRKESSL